MEIQKEVLVKTLKEMKYKGYEYLKFITGIDYPESMNIIYCLHDIKKNKDQILEVKIPKDNGKINDISIESIVNIYPGADWYERELYEMFGIKISGRKIKKLLLEKWNGVDYPMRKDFIWGKPYKKEL